MRRHRNGRILAGAYACLVVVLGVVSVVILLTTENPILLTGVALVVVTLPVGLLIWWGWGLLPTETADPVLLTVILTAGGLLQAYVIWRILRSRSPRESP
jgi:hypothetical protein